MGLKSHLSSSENHGASGKQAQVSKVLFDVYMRTFMVRDVVKKISLQTKVHDTFSCCYCYRHLVVSSGVDLIRNFL